MSSLTARLSRRDASAFLSRISVALPLLTAFVWLCLLYGWEAWGNLTPWLFGDELEKTQLARSIAETGHAARRTVPVSAHSLVAWLTAPAWLVDDTTKAYGLLKAMQVAAMTSVIFPTYLLARQLVSGRWALFAAIGAATIPALSYSSLILEEPFAYPYAAWSAYVLVKALVTRDPRWIAAATATSVVAPFVRGELTVIPAIAVIATCLFVWTGERARRWREGWSTWDWAGFLLLLAGVLIVVNAVIRSHSEEWEIATEFEKQRMIELGLQAAGALTIGLGILPVIAGLALLVPLARERTDATLRAFFAVTATSILAFGFYTGVKAAWNAIKFSTIVAERNLIYLSPLLFVATAIVLERRMRAPLAAIAAAAAFALYLVLTTPYKMEFHFYFDAPGLSILQSANRVLHFTPDDAKVALVVVLVAVTAVLVVRRLTPLLPVAALFVLAWTLTGQITGARSSHQFGDDLTANLPAPLDWVDRADHGQPAIYLGQHLTDFNVVWLLEFWNRSIRHVWSNDGTAPGPGPTLTPDIVKRDGTLFPQPKEDYVLTDAGLEVAGTLVTERAHLAGGLPIPLRLYRIARPLRMRESVEGVFADGWGAPTTAYNQYSTPGNKPGFLVVAVTRSGGGKDLPAVADLTVGRLAIDEQHQPHLGRVLVHPREVRAERDLNARFVLVAPPAPFRAEVVVTPPFRPVDLDPRNQDVRELGAQVDYRFEPRVPAPVPGRAPQLEGVYPDRWMGSSASYTQWSSPRSRPGVVRVRVSRVDWPRIPSSGRVEIRVGGLRNVIVGSSLQLLLARVTAKRTSTIPVGDARTFTLPTPRPPFRVEVRVGSTFVPAKVIGSGDMRELGARVSFSFSAAP